MTKGLLHEYISGAGRVDADVARGLPSMGCAASGLRSGRDRNRTVHDAQWFRSHDVHADVHRARYEERSRHAA
jgi:hypothetical protein